MKKLISLILVFGLLLCCLPPCFAAAEGDAIAIRLNSDVAGCTREDRDRLIEIRSDNVVLATERGWEISIANAAGGEIELGTYVDAAGNEYANYLLIALEPINFADYL